MSRSRIRARLQSNSSRVLGRVIYEFSARIMRAFYARGKCIDGNETLTFIRELQLPRAPHNQSLFLSTGSLRGDEIYRMKATLSYIFDLRTRVIAPAARKKLHFTETKVVLLRPNFSLTPRFLI